MASKKFCWKIWGKKLAINVGAIFLAGLAAHYGDNPYYLAIAPGIKALENYWKNK